MKIEELQVFCSCFSVKSFGEILIENYYSQTLIGKHNIPRGIQKNKRTGDELEMEYKQTVEDHNRLQREKQEAIVADNLELAQRLKEQLRATKIKIHELEDARSEVTYRFSVLELWCYSFLFRCLRIQNLFCPLKTIQPSPQSRLPRPSLLNFVYSTSTAELMCTYQNYRCRIQESMKLPSSEQMCGTYIHMLDGMQNDRNVAKVL